MKVSSVRQDDISSITVIVVVDRTGKHAGKHAGSSIQETSKRGRPTTAKAFCTPLYSHLASICKEKLIASYFFLTQLDNLFAVKLFVTSVPEEGVLFLF